VLELGFSGDRIESADGNGIGGDAGSEAITPMERREHDSSRHRRSHSRLRLQHSAAAAHLHIVAFLDTAKRRVLGINLDEWARFMPL